MVTYNSAAFVADVIASVLAQDFTDFELLVCDDRSTDATWDRVMEFADPRIRAIRNAANLGEYANRNQAVALAAGRYLMFLDGDDILYPHGLGVMVRSLERHPAAAFAAAQPPSDEFMLPVELDPQAYYRCQFLGPNVTAHDFTQLLFRTEALREAGAFDTRFRTGDTHIQLRLGMAHRCLLIPGGLAWWRRYPGQASEALHRGLTGLAELTRYGRELLDQPGCPLDGDERRIARANLARSLLRNACRFLKRGRIRDAVALVRGSGLGTRDAVHFFARERRPYLQRVDGRSPLTARAT